MARGQRRRRDGEERAKRPWLSTAIVAVLLIAALFVLWRPVLDLPFQYDDRRTVVENPSLGSGSVLAVVLYERFRPLTTLSYAVDFLLDGRDPRSYHRTNLFLHLLVALALLALVRAWASDAGAKSGVILPAAAVGLACLHPLQVETVAYVSARSELLAALGGLACLLAYRHWVRSERGVWLGVSLLSFALGLAGKEVVAGIPLLLLAWDAWLGGDQTARRRRRVLGPWIAVVALAGCARLGLWVAAQGGGFAEGGSIS